MHKVISKQVYKVDPSIEPYIQVHPGEAFTVKVQNAFGKSFENTVEFEAFLSKENEEEKKALNHPCTGPIEVITDQTNISLAVQLLDFKVTKGYQCISRSTGLLKGRFEQRMCAIYDVDKDWNLHFRGKDLRMHGSPKLGFISTIDHQVRSCGIACENGGNIDLNFLDLGSVIYLPVNFPKARILIGDLHICQGNGEAAGVGVEADGEITLKIDIVDKVNFPVIHHKQNLVVVGWGDTVEAALQKSVENAIVYLKRIFPFSNWSEGEIYKFISAEGNLTMGNSTGRVKTCGTVFFKKRITNKYLFPVI